MPPHSIKLLIVKTEPVVLASLSISHYLSRRGVLPAHTSAGLGMQTLMAIHQLLPTLPHNHDPGNKTLYTKIRCTLIISTCWLKKITSLLREPGSTDLNEWFTYYTKLIALYGCIVRDINQNIYMQALLSPSICQQVSAGLKFELATVPLTTLPWCYSFGGISANRISQKGNQCFYYTFSSLLFILNHYLVIEFVLRGNTKTSIFAIWNVDVGAHCTLYLL